ncbi:MAG TPA: hypothetical protein VJA21_18130 [Verrucomicrobiae bacterium]
MGLSLAQTTNQPQGPGYSDFRIITERNIFNPRRYARNSPRAARPAARSDAFTLVGTMAYEKGPFAFFEGSNSEYRKVAKIADEIAGFKITNIQYNSVRLSGTSNEVQLAVGMQMRREEDGPWHVASAGESLADRPSANLAGASPAKPGDNSVAPRPVAEAGSPTEETDPSAAPTAGTDDPVLKRLMQRREQEMNR